MTLTNVSFRPFFITLAFSILSVDHVVSQDSQNSARRARLTNFILLIFFLRFLLLLPLLARASSGHDDSPVLKRGCGQRKVHGQRTQAPTSTRSRLLSSAFSDKSRSRVKLSFATFIPDNVAHTNQRHRDGSESVKSKLRKRSRMLMIPSKYVGSIETSRQNN